MIPESVSISNFKSFGLNPGKAPIRPITLVFGPNSAGKSSLLQSLLLLDHAIATGNTDVVTPRSAAGDMDLGGFHQFLNRGSGTKEVIITLSFDYAKIPKNERTQLLGEKSSAITLSLGSDGTRGVEVEADGLLFLKASRKRDGSLGADLIDFEHPALRSLLKIRSIPEKFSKPPILIPGLAEAMNLKPFNILADLIKMGVFPAPSQPLEPEIAAKLCSIHGFTLLQPAQLRKALADQDELSKLSIRTDGIVPEELMVRPTTETGEPGHSDHEYETLAATITQHLQWLKPRLIAFTESILHIPPLRELPPRTFDLGQNPDSVWAKIVNDDAVRKRIDEWLGGGSEASKHMHARYRLAVREYIPTDNLKSRVATGLDQQILTLVDFKEMGFGSALENLTQQIKEDYDTLDKVHYVKANPELREALIADELEILLSIAEDDDDASDWHRSLLDLSSAEQRAEASQMLMDALGSEGLVDKYFQIWEHFRANYPELRRFVSDYLDIDTAATAMTSTLRGEISGIRREIALTALPSNTLVSLKDVGIGISQVLPILASAFGESNRCIAVEQPEIHIHPRLQAELGDVFIESALGIKKNTYLIETHSEHLILRILRRIRETTEGEIEDWPDALRGACPNGIRPEDVAVLYVEPGEEGAKVRHLRINELGEFIDEWPGGFFDERSREIF